jgi:hypothetical protein
MPLQQQSLLQDRGLLWQTQAVGSAVLSQQRLLLLQDTGLLLGAWGSAAPVQQHLLLQDRVLLQD